MKRRAARKIAVRSDMEGLTGVIGYHQVTPGAAQYAYGQAMLMAELEALLGGLQAGGVATISVYDEHFFGANIDLARVPAGTSVICGKPPYRADWAGGLDASFDGMVLLGLHARAGTPDAVLAHTYERDIRNLWVNGRLLGEIGVEAAIAGDCGVPLLLVIADSAGVAEAENLLPGVAGVAVKQSLPGDGCQCFPLSETTSWIRTAARKIACNPPPVAPWRIPGPIELEIELNAGAYRDAFRREFGKHMVASDRLRLTASSVSEAWARYWAMKLAAQQAADRRPARRTRRRRNALAHAAC